MGNSTTICYIGQHESIPTSTGFKSSPIKAQMVCTIQKDNIPISIDLSEDKKAFCFYSNFKYWKESTLFMSSNNYDNNYFRAIVDMGEDAVPYIKAELEKGPTSLVHALDLIYPGRVKFNGFVSLRKACNIWLTVLNG